MSKKTLLLDVMSTLVHDPVFDTLPAFFGCDARTLLSQLDPSRWYAFEEGRIDEATWLDTCFYDGRRVDGPGLRAAMLEGYRWLPGIEDLLKGLKAADIEMHALSNYPRWSTLVEAKLRLSRFMSWDFVSWRTGVRKPNPQAYLGVAMALGVAPSDCIFVDDQPANVAAAQAVGMTALFFEGAEPLRLSLDQAFGPKPTIK